VDLTPEALVSATGCLLADAALIAKPLGDAMRKYGVVGRLRAAAFLAQTAHESMRFHRLAENLNYRDPERLIAIWPSRFGSYELAMQYVHNPERLANFVYADRNGNGSEASGDGYAFRGRGLIQITGRDLYTQYGHDIGEPVLTQPDLLATPAYAADSAGWYWSKIGANMLADEGQFDRITRRINPALAGLEDRRALYQQAFRSISPG